MEISVDDLALFKKDKIAVAAKAFGVSKELYMRWAEFIKNPQCHARTRKGHQCRNYVELSDLSSPENFDPRKVYFCKIHVEHTEKPEVYRGKR